VTELANWSVQGTIASLTVNNPPVNAISQPVRAALLAGVKRAEADPSIGALVIACTGRTFFAGADLREFGKPSTEPFLTEVVDTIEGAAKPVVAAIHGTALGGGLEIAMACHYRVADVGSRLALPEVKLGLMPGARGTQHLPRLVGVEKALEIIALGNPISADDALKSGLVDIVAHNDLVESAVRQAGGIAAVPPRRTRDLTVVPVADAVYATFRDRNAKRFRGLAAPPAIIASVRAATELPFEEGARREREIFLELRAGPQNEALRYAFFAEREAAKLPGLKDTVPHEVTRTGVIGAGTMGSGIAIALLAAGLPVTLFERDPAALERGVGHVRKRFQANIASGRMTAERAEQAIERLSPTAEKSALHDADLVIEATYEAMDVKQAIFSALDKIAKPGAILAAIPPISISIRSPRPPRAPPMCWACISSHRRIS
jgi:3-hydroxyacyl-CoA dehydrogenase